jgi:predicted MFS family arabinose efflux permease
VTAPDTAGDEVDASAAGATAASPRPTDRPESACDGDGATEAGSRPADSSPADRRVRTVDVLGDRNFWPFFVGNVLSNCGTWFQNIAQTLLVYRLTGSLALVGVVNFAHFAGVFVVAPFSGVAADVLDRRRLLLTTQLVAAALTTVLAGASFTGLVTTPLVVAIVLLLGLAQAFAVPSLLAFVPQLVPPSRLGPAVALNLISFNLARVIGPVLGALVVAHLGFTAAFAVNAGSFLALVAGLLVVRPRARPRPVAAVDAVGAVDATERPRLRDTVRTVRSAPRLAVLFLAGGTASLAIDPVNTLTPAFATDVYGRSDTVAGWLIGAFGGGAVVAAFVVANRGLASNRRLAGLLVLLVVGMAGFAVVPWLAVGMLALAVAGFAFLGGATSALARLQHTIADAEQGRMMALWTLAFMGTRPIGSLVDGFVASQLDVHVATLVLLIPVLVAIAALVLWDAAGEGQRGGGAGGRQVG